AGLLGVGFDEIVKRDQRARRRRNRFWAALAASFVFLAVTATASAVYAFNKLVESEENLDHAVEFAYGFVSEAVAEADRFGVSVDMTLRLLQRAGQALDSLIKAGRDTPQLRYRRALMLLSFSDAYRKLGRSQDALDRAEQARADLTALVAQRPDRPSWTRDLAIAHNKIGDIQGEQGALGDALAHYRSALELLQRLTVLDPSRLDWQLDLARTFEKIGNALSDQGSHADALVAYRQARGRSARGRKGGAPKQEGAEGVARPPHPRAPALSHQR